MQLKQEDLLPKRVINYINEIGVRSLDHLAERFQALPKDASEGAERLAVNAIQTLVDSWKAMTTDDKQEFVGRVAGSVVAVVAASAALPLGLKKGKKLIKATRKVVKREAKRLRKVAKGKTKTKTKDKPKNKAKAKPRSKAKTATTKQKAS
jgi:hypothetical protein